MRLSLSLIISSLLLAGCATNAAVPPSQNPSLQAVSPNTAAASEGGAMQRSLDSWLKEEWSPLTTPTPTQISVPATEQSSSGSINAPTPEGTATSTAAATPTEDETPFTLQKYADKWKVYHENKAKMNEGKSKEPSHIDAVNALPVIGK